MTFIPLTICKTIVLKWMHPNIPIFIFKWRHVEIYCSLKCVGILVFPHYVHYHLFTWSIRANVSWNTVSDVHCYLFVEQIYASKSPKCTPSSVNAWNRARYARHQQYFAWQTRSFFCMFNRVFPNCWALNQSFSLHKDIAVEECRNTKVIDSPLWDYKVPAFSLSSSLQRDWMFESGNDSARVFKAHQGAGIWYPLTTFQKSQIFSFITGKWCDLKGLQLMTWPLAVPELISTSNLRWFK